MFCSVCLDDPVWWCCSWTLLTVFHHPISLPVRDPCDHIQPYSKVSALLIILSSKLTCFLRQTAVGKHCMHSPSILHHADTLWKLPITVCTKLCRGDFSADKSSNSVSYKPRHYDDRKWRKCPPFQFIPVLVVYRRHQGSPCSTYHHNNGIFCSKISGFWLKRIISYPSLHENDQSIGGVDAD